MQFPLLTGLFDAKLDLPDGVKIFVQLALVIAADVAANVLGILKDGVEHTLVTALDLVFEQAIEGEGWIDLQGCWGGGRCP